MTVSAGIVCGKCDRLNPIDEQDCGECGSSLKLVQTDSTFVHVDMSDAGAPEVAVPGQNDPPPEAAQQEAEGEPMEQARHMICSSCYSPIPSGHKFCGKCGTVVEDSGQAEPNFFGDMQTPGKAKLILIKGEGMDGISYHLNSTEHVAGRKEGPILFTEDKWLSPKHANFYYDDGKLMVRDEGSVNGIFIALQGSIDAIPGTVFMAGEQVFRIDTVEPYNDDPEADGTYFFSSPRTESSFKIVQILEGGGEGMVVNSTENAVVVGREGCDMNFPNDPYISGIHVKVEFAGGKLVLTDMNSKNGTYIKVDAERELVHGNYVFLGRQLLRVEITA